MLAARRVPALLLDLAVFAWIAWTLYAVARYGSAVLLDLDTTSRLMAVRNDGDIDSAIGLTYHGPGGAALVIVELLLVSAAAAASLTRRRGPRRVGSTLLVGWSALWLGNALWLQSRGWDRPGDVLALACATIAVLAWAGLRWRRVGARTPCASAA